MTLFILNTRRRRLQFIKGGRNFRLSGLEFIIIPNGQTIDESQLEWLELDSFVWRIYEINLEIKNRIFLAVMPYYTIVKFGQWEWEISGT